jgi:hypothetical protein
MARRAYRRPRLEDLCVARFLSWICGEVGRIVELPRVHENRGDDVIARQAGGSHQCDVAVVKRAHRRKETDSLRPREGFAHLRDGAKDSHVYPFTMSSSPLGLHF